MKPRYRKKGTWTTGETKIVIEYFDELGKMRTFTLPKARTLLNVLEKLNFQEGYETKLGRKKPFTKRTQSSQ